MISMTGFGYAERSDSTVTASVEVKSVNNRYLDISVSLPNGLSVLEPRVREQIGASARRGRVDVTVRLRELEEATLVRLDRSALAGYQQALEELQDATGCDGPIALSHYLSMDGIFRLEHDRDVDRYWAVVGPLLDDALAAFRDSRTAEGVALQRDILTQVDRVSAGLDAVRAHAPEIEQNVRSQLGQRFAEVVGDGVEEPRMLAEVATQLARFSINEEIVRLQAHVDSMRQLIGEASATASASGVGKRLDFICQEINREINTIGSKSTVLAISEQVIETKDALENIREQLRNVE